MNDYVKASIDSRKNAFYNAYNITDTNLVAKIDELFNKINELGMTCSDANDFEIKFASSPLNQEYINLFTELATTCPPITYESSNVNVKSDEDYIKDEIDSEIRYQADNLSQPIRHEMYQKTYDAVRDVPVVGNVLDAKQKFDFFSRFKKKKDE